MQTGQTACLRQFHRSVSVHSFPAENNLMAYRSIPEGFIRNRWRIVEGDEVVVRGTRFAGQIGKVLAVIRDKRVPQVVVEGVNLVSKRPHDAS